MSGAVAKIDRAMCSAIRDYRNAKYPAMEVIQSAKAVEGVPGPADKDLKKDKDSKKDSKDAKKDSKKA